MAQHRVDYLTVTQERILRCIRRRIVEDGESPTVAELGDELGLSAGGVHYQLGELEAKAAIVREPGQPRGIRLT
jgi:repressor LexA